MAETLTFEQEVETTSVDNLSEEEQDSLRVGESMQEAQDDLLAGKYKSAQELENAYIELQKKLGDNKPEATEEPVEQEESSNPLTTKGAKETKEETKEEKPDDTANILEDLWEQSQGKNISEDMISKINEMNPQDLAKMHLEYRASQGNQDLSENDVKELKGIVGGEENYANMMQWATSNLQEQEVNMFDTVMERGDPLAAFFAVRSLAYRYNDAVGYDGKMVTGTAPKSNADVFKSQQEVVRAMGDPRYDNDPAYRREVMEKLDRSDVNF